MWSPVVTKTGSQCMKMASASRKQKQLSIKHMLSSVKPVSWKRAALTVEYTFIIYQIIPKIPDHTKFLFTFANLIFRNTHM